MLPTTYQGYSATYGARPLRRAVQRLIEDPVAEAVLDGFCADGALQLDVDSNGTPPPPPLP